MTGLLHEKEFSRKSFVKGGGALIVSFSLAGSLLAGTAQAANTPNVAPVSTQVDSWLAILADGSVLMFPPKMEFGQGTYTGFRQIVADEMYVPVESINIPLWDTGSAHPFPNNPTSSTVGSNGTANGGPAIRQAAAAAYQALLKLASTNLGVPVGSLSVANGVVSGGGKSVSYATLVGGQMLNTAITGLEPLKSPTQYTVVGTRVPRFDIPNIVTAEKTYIQNVRLPGMLDGRVIRPLGQANLFAPTQQGGLANFTLLSVDASSIAHIPNVQIVQKENFLGVVAPLEYDAVQGGRGVEGNVGAGGQPARRRRPVRRDARRSEPALRRCSTTESSSTVWASAAKGADGNL